MKLSRIGRVSMALVVSVAMGLGMTACGGGTIGFMWVLGTQFNQIAAFKIDDFTGNLTTVPHSPFTSGGTNPVSLVVRTGGRYLYVINQGSALPTDSQGGVTCQAGAGGGSIAEFAIGGQGVLTFQQTFQSQGCTPVWAAHDSTGGFLYVLDKYAPNAKCLSNGQPEPSSTPVANTCNGEITVFSSDSTTGRLTLVLNQQIKDNGPTGTGQQLTYFPVGALPKMLATSGSCLFTLNQDLNQTVFPYGTGGSGQLTRTTNDTINTGAIRATSIISGGTSVYITDAGLVNTNTPGRILPFTVGGTACSLNTITGGPTQNLSPGANPIYTLVDSKGAYLYVANQSSTDSTNANSSISGFVFNTNGTFQQIAGQPNPYPIGAGPVCMVEDPSNQYIYTSNGDGTVTGKVLNAPTGQLLNLSRGSTFTAVGQATCLAVSGNVD
jgi:DNA-binding beta-propeller fold protein YncE